MTTKSDARKGYSSALVRIVNQADPNLVVTKFAKYCIAKDIPATEIAENFGVSRATVYFWFKGTYAPRERHVAKMLQILVEAEVRSA